MPPLLPVAHEIDEHAGRPRPLGRSDVTVASLHGTATLRSYREAGRAVAVSLSKLPCQRALPEDVRHRTCALRRVIYSGFSTHAGSRLHQDWLAGNARLIVSTEKDLRGLATRTRGLPTVEAPRGATDKIGLPTLRICAVVEAYLDCVQGTFDEELFVAFVHGVQEVCELEMGEVWAGKPALELAILERIVAAAAANRGELPVLITSLRTVSESRWTETFAAINVIDPVLARDPIGAYAAMDDESRDHYRHVIADLSRHSDKSEREVAEIAIRHATDARRSGDSSRVAQRRAHVGFYLIDRGLPFLKAYVGYRAPLRQRIADVACTRPTWFYLTSLVVVTAAIVTAVHTMLGPGPIAAIVLLLLPATQAAVDLVNEVVMWLVRPRRLPKLDFSDGIPDDCATMVAVPAILLNERHVRELVMDMEIRFLANRDPNLSFALVTNSRDSKQCSDERHDVLQLCERLIRGLNERYGGRGRTPFYLFHRRLAFYPSEGRWMGWERKRGKLLDLNQLLRGVRDRFPVKIGNLEALRRIRYVITLDSDTELPRDAARRLVGAIAHPLNRAVIDPATKTVVEGYGILQPRISVSTHSASRSWLASLSRPLRRRDLYGQRHLRGRRVPRVAGAAVPVEYASQSRPHRRPVRKGGSRLGDRAGRGLSDAFQRVLPAETSLAAWRLAGIALASESRSRFQTEDRRESAERHLALEDSR
jgi:cyclic beta-1,2-glucan glucanotransferase